jgi:hypothetical protein
MSLLRRPLLSPLADTAPFVIRPSAAADPGDVVIARTRLATPSRSTASITWSTSAAAPSRRSPPSCSSAATCWRTASAWTSRRPSSTR